MWRGRLLAGALALIVALAGIVPLGRPVQADPASDRFLSLTIRTLDPRTNLPLPGACYIVLGVSGERCDDAGTGNVHVGDILPGDYSVAQTRAPAGFLRSAPFAVSVAASGPAYQWAYVSPDPDPAAAPGPLTIRTVDQQTGDVVPGVCLALAGTANRGCDDDGDGAIMLAGVPAGSYHIAIQEAPGDYRIAFTASAPNFVPPADRQTVDLPLRDYGDAATDSP
jgi:hypothetical protein